MMEMMKRFDERTRKMVEKRAHSCTSIRTGVNVNNRKTKQK